jgi:predicted  nucleic acid-binding Zn-ribbon protein
VSDVDRRLDKVVAENVRQQQGLFDVKEALEAMRTTQSQMKDSVTRSFGVLSMAVNDIKSALDRDSKDRALDREERKDRQRTLDGRLDRIETRIDRVETHTSDVDKSVKNILTENALMHVRTGDMLTGAINRMQQMLHQRLVVVYGAIVVLAVAAVIVLLWVR